jgi:hypothetical protein
LGLYSWTRGWQSADHSRVRIGCDDRRSADLDEIAMDEFGSAVD